MKPHGRLEGKTLSSKPRLMKSSESYTDAIPVLDVSAVSIVLLRYSRYTIHDTCLIPFSGFLSFLSHQISRFGLSVLDYPYLDIVADKFFERWLRETY